MNFGLNGYSETSLEDIGELLNRSRAAISLNRVKAMKKLRASRGKIIEAVGLIG